MFNFSIGYNQGANPLYNGNLSQTQWRTANTDSSLKTYAYTYDALDRITGATDNTGNYNVSNIGYDKNGNIQSLTRNGYQDSSNFTDMDILDYGYDSGNRLLKVTDTGNKAHGFKDGTNTNDDFEYDDNGNLKIDRNKGITGITYNHLNLPEQVDFGSQNIQYVYDATGAKLKRTSSSGTETLYAGNHIYEGGVGNAQLQFFSHPEGYVTPDGQGGYDYVYNYVDHLGSVRLSYTDADGNGSIDPANEIVEENHFYPFGLKMKGFNGGISTLGNSLVKKFKYQGQELDESFGYNMYEFQLRHYDPTTGRFVTMDPYEQFMSPYLAMGNNPVVAYDPDGGNCYDANGNVIVCPDGGEYDEFRDSDKNHLTVLPEVVVTGTTSSADDSSTSSSSEMVNINDIIGTQVLPKKRTVLGRVVATLEPRTVELDGFAYRVDANGTATGLQPATGLGAIGLIGGLGSGGNLLKFKGLTQNLRLSSLTHQQLVKAFKGTGLKLSGHAITRLKSIRTQSLGINTLNDFKQIINKGTKFDAGSGAVGFSHKGTEVIINP